MQKLLSLLLMLCCVATATAQQAPAPAPAPPTDKHDWARAQALRPGASIHVSKLQGGFNCHVVIVAPDAITCTASGGPQTVARADIKSIKQHHRWRSAFATGGGTAVIGFLIGFGAGGSPNGFFGPNFLRGAIAGVSAVLGFLIGVPIGYFTDDLGTTVYHAP